MKLNTASVSICSGSNAGRPAVKDHGDPVSDSARTDPVVQCPEAVMQYHRVRRSRHS